MDDEVSTASVLLMLTVNVRTRIDIYTKSTARPPQDLAHELPGCHKRGITDCRGHTLLGRRPATPVQCRGACTTQGRSSGRILRRFRGKGWGAKVGGGGAEDPVWVHDTYHAPTALPT